MEFDERLKQELNRMNRHINLVHLLEMGFYGFLIILFLIVMVFADKMR